MIFSTKKLSSNHNLQQISIQLQLDNKALEKVQNTSLLGTVIDEHLTWNKHIKSILSSCYSKLSVLRKLNNMTTFKLRKQLNKSLVFSKINFNDVVYAPLTQTQLRKIQRLQLSACSFVFGRYVKMESVPKLTWLPIAQRRKFHVLKTAFKAITDVSWPTLNRIDERLSIRNLRNSCDRRISPSLCKGTLQDQTSSAFNNLPVKIRNAEDLSSFCKMCKQHRLLLRSLSNDVTADGTKNS